MKAKTRELLRLLPSIDTLLEHEEVQSWTQALSRAMVIASLRSAVAMTREAILTGQIAHPVGLEELRALAEEELTRHALSSLQRVINATGIVLHTGLGRAPLCEAAVDAIVETATGYCNLEYQLEGGTRGRRVDHVVESLKQITGAEAATVVNNNAAATLLILSVLASGREVIVSRGQLIEIGGSFRLLDIMRASGAILREVGTTNRTRIDDYEQQINDTTAALLRVHTSNFRVVGFTEEVPLEQMVTLARRFELPVIDDLGSGAVFDISDHGLPFEPPVSLSIRAGADLVCFSGDKLLGGPQCGIIVGRADLVSKIESSPLMRTYRVDKLTLAALEATLKHYIDQDDAISSIPVLSMLTTSTETLAERANELSQELDRALPDERFLVCSDVGFAGGGSLPDRAMDTVVVQWRPSSLSADEAIKALRQAEVPVVARIHDEAVCFDLRTIQPSEFEDLIAGITSAVTESEAKPDDDGNISLPIL